MIKKLKVNKKKKGFTLVELIAVMAIIGILAVILVPKVYGYIEEGKKVVVIDQARKVVMAVETSDIKKNTTLKETGTGSTLNTIFTANPYVLKLAADTSTVADAHKPGNLDKLNGNMTLGNCIDILDNTKDFNIDSSGKYKTASK